MGQCSLASHSPDTIFWPFHSCFLQVQPKHVKEAFRLLNKSIIRVETPDINLDQEEELEEEEQMEEGTSTCIQVHMLRYKDA